jgi:hypothetical protein
VPTLYTALLCSVSFFIQILDIQVSFVAAVFAAANFVVVSEKYIFRMVENNLTLNWKEMI